MALASASNEFGACDYVLPVAHPARTTDTLQIRGIFFSTFFGGGDPTLATPADACADFAAFVLSSGYVGP